VPLHKLPLEKKKEEEEGGKIKLIGVYGGVTIGLLLPIFGSSHKKRERKKIKKNNYRKKTKKIYIVVRRELMGASKIAKY
jgi:hypothetical protein